MKEPASQVYLVNEENYSLATHDCIPVDVLFNGDGMAGLSNGDGLAIRSQGLSYVYTEALVTGYYYE